LDKQSAGEVQLLPVGVGDGLDGVAVGGRPAANEFVAVIDVNNMARIIIGAAILSPVRNWNTIFRLRFFEENIKKSFRG